LTDGRSVGFHRPVTQDADSRATAVIDALDALIESERRLFDAYVSRSSTAETRAAGELTAVFAVATVTVAVSRSVSLSHTVVVAASIGYALLLVAMIIAAARLVAGLRRSEAPGLSGRLVSVESPRFRRAKKNLDDIAALPASFDVRPPSALDIDPIAVRLRILELWRARTADAHRVATDADRWTFGALVFLVLGVLCMAALGLLLVAGVGVSK
jgi:hypothetical protein